MVVQDDDIYAFTEFDFVESETDYFPDALSSEEKALLKSNDFMSLIEWHGKNIQEYLQVFFQEHPSNATWAALKRLADFSLTFEEFILVVRTKELLESDFSYSDYDDTGVYNFKIRQKYFPWPTLLSIVRSFNGYPDFEEIEMLLHELDEEWVNHPSYVRQFSSFAIFLKYRFLNIDEHLPQFAEFQDNQFTQLYWHTNHDIQQVQKEKDLEKWGISKPKTSNLRTIESGILEQFDREMEEERVAKLEAKSSKAKQSEEDDEEIECEVNE